MFWFKTFKKGNKLKHLSWWLKWGTYKSQNCMAIITNHVGHSLKFLKSPALSWASFSLLFSAIGAFAILMEPHHSSTESYEGGLEIRFKEIKASLQRFVGPDVVGSNFDWKGGKSFTQFMLTVSVPNVMARKEIHENIQLCSKFLISNWTTKIECESKIS